MRRRLVVSMAVAGLFALGSVGSAWAHPAQAQSGLAKAPDNAAIAVATTALANSDEANVNGVLQEPAGVDSADFSKRPRPRGRAPDQGV